MYKVMQNVIHPETRAIMLRAGSTVSAARIDALRKLTGFDSTPDLLAAGVLTQAPIYPGNSDHCALRAYYANK
jgi:hypothetical protein